MLKNKIKNNLEVGGINHLFNKILYRFMSLFRVILPKEFFFKFEFFCFIGYWPNFDTPRSLNEKIVYRKRYNPHSLSTLVADKYAVREYIKQKGLDNILNEILWNGTASQKIPFASLPEKYVVKATHGSGWNIIVQNKNSVDINSIIQQCESWLSTKYSTKFDESFYDKITPRIIVEEFIEDKLYTIPLDYKFFCFGGKVEFIQVDSERFTRHKRNIYDASWNKIPIKYNFPLGRWINKPTKLQEMVHIAELIAEDFDFCRVDLYCQNNFRIIFGEITLTPDAGLGRLNPIDWDFKLGELWKN